MGNSERPRPVGFEKDPARKLEKRDLPPQEESAEDCWMRELAEFIVEANRETWAADKGKVEPTRPGFKRHVYERGDWKLDDEYTGHFKAPGMTTVFYKDIPVWVMQYGGGGMQKGYEERSKEAYAFLRKALMRVTLELPFRGPEEYSEDGWRYVLKLKLRSIKNFEGFEQIYTPSGVWIFDQTIMGGIIVHKNPQGEPLYPWNL